MSRRERGVLLATALALLSYFSPVDAAQKCGPCACSNVQAELGGTGTGLLVNCSGVATPLGDLPHPALSQDPQLQDALGHTAFVHLVLSKCDANRVQAIPSLAAPLRKVDLSNNRLTELEDNVFQLHNDTLTELTLDFNSLTELDSNALKDLKELLVLKVEHNALKELRLEALPVGLLRLRAASNAITQLVAAPNRSRAMQLQDLDLYGNKFVELNPATQQALFSLMELRRLRLAGNPFKILDGSSLLQIPQLRELDISKCGLKELGFRNANHSKLVVLSAGHNALSAVEVAAVASALPNLQDLQLSHNAIDQFPLQIPHTALQVLNLSDNSILSLPPVLPTLKSLHELDLSSNKLQTVPSGALGAPSLPHLRALWLDGNEPLATLKLDAPLPHLQILSVRGPTRLRVLDGAAFKGLSTLSRGSGDSYSCGTSSDGSLSGISLYLSGNHELTSIDEKTFEGLQLCELDLSGCALVSVSEHLAPWSVMRTVDLQGNPWACECSLQWMVDKVVVPMYNKGSSQLLYELRCETPAELRDRRLVHFYSWPNALCSPREKLQRMMSPEAASNTLSAGRGMLIALCAVGVIFLATVIAGLTMHYQALKRRRRQNRRI